MAPDRGSSEGHEDDALMQHASSNPEPTDGSSSPIIQTQPDPAFLAKHASEPQNFTVRSLLVGLGIGIVICFSNTYFGLQTGWVSGMAMPSALLGFAWFKALGRYIDFPFTPVENVLVQTVAGAVGTMPLGCGFVGVIPALEFLLKDKEGGPLVLSFWKLAVWAVGVCFFGVFVAVPLRREVILREKLKFPSGTATALVIGVLHGGEKGAENTMDTISRRSTDMLRPWATLSDVDQAAQEAPDDTDKRGDWKAKIRMLAMAFGVSAVYTLVSYFIPQIRDIPILGMTLAQDWLWTLNPSPAYIGQGIIMGPATTLHMLLGAMIGWAVLSPLAKQRGWAPGPVDDWTTGSKGWIVWVSLAIMLADSIINLGWLILRSAIQHGPDWIGSLKEQYQSGSLTSVFKGYTALQTSEDSSPAATHRITRHYSSMSNKNVDEEEPEADAPPEHLVANKIVYPGLLVSLILCVVCTHITFPGAINILSTILAVILSLLLSLMGVRALGETDLNPVSGISKLTQLVFAAITPPGSSNAITTNLIAGALSESAALQAGDMMQDLKTGHLLGASPKAQFYGQMIGSAFGALVSAGVYKLYTSVYTIPGGMFQVPTGYVWIFTARLVTGQGLPAMAGPWAVGAGVLWVILTAIRIRGQNTAWQAWIPGGIAVAVGMYNVPSFTLARAVGGCIAGWSSRKGKGQEVAVILASGLILGEGVVSIVNLLLASTEVPHL
jgi:OPT family oligopeptide transporter